MKRIIIFLSTILTLTSVMAQTAGKFIREGNKLYNSEKYSDAEVSYRKASEKKANMFESDFNIGDALYKQGKYEDAAKQFELASKNTTNKRKQAAAYHNFGNSMLKARKPDQAIPAYKNALKIDPKNEDTRSNLAYAQQLLKQQQNQQNKDNKNNKDKKDDKKDQNKDNKDKDKKDDKKNPNKDNKDDKQDKSNPQKQDQQQQKPQISQEDAKRMLEAIQNDEKDVQKRLQEQKNKGQKVQVLKNW